MYPCLPIDRCGLMHLFLSLMLSLTLLELSFAQDPAQAANAFKGNDSTYQLSIKDQKINLKAEDASLKMILEVIGQEMNVEMIVRIPEEDKVTLQFNDQSLEDTLKFFKVNYAMVTDSEDKGGKIKWIVVVPEGQQAQIAMTTSGNSHKQNKKGLKQETGSKDEPFKFEFDPSIVIEEEN